MEQLLTANVATSLYWLGRYLARVEATLSKVTTAYDCAIDMNKKAGVELYKQLGVEIEYNNSIEFLQQAIFGEHASNIFDLLTNARENAIISRNYINTDAFGEIIALHTLFKNLFHNRMPIDYKDIDNANSLISEIWGNVLKRELRRNSEYFLRLGELVEIADFHFRFEDDNNLAIALVNNIHTIIDILSIDGHVTASTESVINIDDPEKTMQEIYKSIDKLIVE